MLVLSKLQSDLVSYILAQKLEVIQLYWVRNWYRLAGGSRLEERRELARHDINRRLRGVAISVLIKPLVEKSVLHPLGEGAYLLNRSCLVRRTTDYRWIVDPSCRPSEETLLRYSCSPESPESPESDSISTLS